MEIRLIRRLILFALESSCGVSGKLSTQASEPECWICNQHRCICEQPGAAPFTMITAGLQLNWWLIWVNSPKATGWQTSVKFSPLFSVTSEDFYIQCWSFFVFVEAEDRSSGRESLQPNPAHSFESSLLVGPPERANPGALPPFSPHLFYLLSFYRPEPLVLQPLPWHEESLWLFPLQRVRNNERLHEFFSRTEPKKLKTECTWLFQNLGSSSFLPIFFSQLLPLLWVPFFPLLPPSPPLFLWFCLSSRSLDSRLPSDFSNFLTCSLISSFHVVTPTRGKETQGQAFPWLAAMFWLVTIQQAQEKYREKIGIDSGLHCLKSADCWLHFNTLSLHKSMQRTHDVMWVTSKCLKSFYKIFQIHRKNIFPGSPSFGSMSHPKGEGEASWSLSGLSSSPSINRVGIKCAVYLESKHLQIREECIIISHPMWFTSRTKAFSQLPRWPAGGWVCSRALWCFIWFHEPFFTVPHLLAR